MDDLELGWVAGLFEGEGCIHITKDGRTVRLAVPSVDLDIVERLLSLVKIGAIYHSNYKVGNGDTHTMHKWQAQKLLEVQELLRILLPHFGTRSTAKALEALAIEPNPNGFGPRALRTHCKHGHEFTEENTLPGRRCRLCRNARALKAYHTKVSIQATPVLSSE